MKNSEGRQRGAWNAGCETVLYGLESANDTILKSMRKGI